MQSMLPQSDVSIILLHTVMLFVGFSNILPGLCNLASLSLRMIILFPSLPTVTLILLWISMTIDLAQGLIFFVNHGPVLWASCKQASCASSTIEAEYLLHPPLPTRLSGTDDCSSVLGKPPLLLPLYSLTIRVLCVSSRIMNSIDGLNTSMFSTTSYAKHF